MKIPFIICLLSFLPLSSEAASNKNLSEVTMPLLKELLPSNPFVLPAEKVDEITRKSGLTVEELLVQLIPLAKTFARPPISGYQVGEAALGKSGAIYLGVNVEFLGRPLNEAVHGEQFLITNARNLGETEIVVMALPAAPCGHCRQFLNEMEGAGRLQILTPHAPPRALSSLLPESFGPKDLGLSGNLLAQPDHIPSFHQELPLIAKALQAAFTSYAPYSNSKSGIAIRTQDGKIYAGSYLENVAFNPSLSPLQSAIVALVADRREYEEICEVVLVEHLDAKISHETTTRELLRQLAPHAKFQMARREF